MAYNYTTVAPEKSQAGIRKLMIAHGSTNIAFASDNEKNLEGLRATVIIDDQPYAVKIVVPVQERRDKEQEIRRVWRVLYHHIKSIFVATDSGVIDIRDLLLPYFVTRDGRTVGEFARDDLQKALFAPKRTFLG